MEIEFQLDGPADAPVLVLSNSLGTTWEMWQAQIPALTQRFRVLRYNTRGHGATPLPERPLTLAQLGQDVVALLDHLGIARAAFCGISLGGLTGMWLNRYAPTRFSALVVANTAARIGTPQGWRERAALVREQGMAAVAGGTPGRWFTEAYCQQHPATVAGLIATLSRQDPAGYAACCEALAGADLRAELPAMTRPMLAIAGREDPVTTVSDGEQIMTAAPAARLTILPASHLSNVACPQAFSQQLMAFISEESAHVAHH